MKKNNKLVTATIVLVSILSTTNITAQSYKDDINAWYQTRIKSLTAETGWLNLAGLFWLDEGKNSFGSGDQSKIKFPKGTIPAEAGYFELKGDTVTQYSNKGVTILVNGQATEKAIVFGKGITPAPASACGDLRWTVIKRGDKIGIRLRNLKSEVVTYFKGIEHYPADTSWVVTATLESSPVLSNISITNILGQVHEEKSPGKLHFAIAGHEYKLDALEENNKLFIIFADGTSGEATYPTGRFLVAEKTVDGGTTILDFNKAYNPPCAFSDYATCPVPPKQNVLPIDVTAGEKNYGHHNLQ